MMTTTTIHQPFSSSSSYSSFSPFFPLQTKLKSFQMFNTPPPYLYLKNQLNSSLYSLHFSTNNNTSNDSTSFAVSYLINNLGFSPQSASKLCSTYNLHFKNAQNPDSVLNFFRNHGFSDTQLRDIIAKSPWLLSCNPSKRVLPKFEFLLSKGASNSDIVNLVCTNPAVLSASLENRIVPAYELLYRFLQSDKEIIDHVIHRPYLLSSHRVSNNFKMLVDSGVTDTTIGILLSSHCWLFKTDKMPKMVEELKNSGFNPSKIPFGIALVARENESTWKKKLDLYKKWGWSDEDVEEALKKQPQCMLISINKINSVMSFWVNQIGWDAKAPLILSLSLEKRIAPRAPVVQFLLKKGLRKKNASLVSPFIVSDKMFRDNFINRYEEESSYLSKLYEENLTLAHTREDKTDMS